ncbi:kinesin protein KIN-14N [Trifolium repens]|nr:kinesin protein KIN-14N [Trifolium repens]
MDNSGSKSDEVMLLIFVKGTPWTKKGSTYSIQEKTFPICNSLVWLNGCSKCSNTSDCENALPNEEYSVDTHLLIDMFMRVESWSHTELSEGEVEELSVKHRIVDDKIREALSKILDIKGSIRMFCRTRPNHLTEKRRNSEPVSAGSERIQIKLGGTRKDFEFDKVFPQETSQCANRCYMCLSDLLGLGGRWIFVSIVLI